MALRRIGRCEKRKASHLRLVNRITPTPGEELFRASALVVLDLPVLTVFSKDDEKYAADVARLVAQT